MKPKVVLMVDTECEFGRIVLNPRDSIKRRILMTASYIAGIDYSINKFKTMVEILKKHDMPATFFIVGSLLEAENEIVSEYLRRDIKTKFIFEKKKLAKVIPSWSDFVKSEISNSIFEVGCHNFLHESNYIETDENIRASISYSKKAASKLGIDIKSYAAPWFELENPENPQRIYGLLKEEGISLTRFDGTRAIHDKSLNPYSGSGFHNRHGVNCIYSSYFIRSGSPNNAELQLVEAGLKQAIENETIYAISTHETTFFRHGFGHFENILKVILKYRDQVDLCTLKDAAIRHNLI